MDALDSEHWVHPTSDGVWFGLEFLVRFALGRTVFKIFAPKLPIEITYDDVLCVICLRDVYNKFGVLQMEN